MEIASVSDDRLEFRHDGVAGSQRLVWIVVACVIAVALATLWGGSYVALVLVLVVGSFFVALLRRSSADSTVVFDRSKGLVEISHSRAGTVLAHVENPVEQISSVIVEAGSRTDRTDRRLSLRPALVIEKDIVPLTWSAFVSGRDPIDCALGIRRFLGEPEDGLYSDSVEALARYSGRVNPAVRIARIGMGLSRLEAADLVTKLRGPASG